MRFGILGGTFDPIHLGHLRTAEEIGQELRLEKVYFIPSASPPHKNNRPVTPFHHRLAMVRLALGDSSLLEILDLEGGRRGPSYSIETLREIHDLFRPGPAPFFILGMDAFLEIKTWKKYRSLFDYAHFVVVGRPGYSDERLESFVQDLGLKVSRDHDPLPTPLPGRTVILMESTIIDISSTRLRKMISEGKSTRFLLPEPVRGYIMEKGLYKKDADN